ncbi:MAG: translational GTPase TypA [Rhodospirillaceae bacterium]|jgi:GTP-binding protein|nr:translational GTPase TypA [Rhodospirillaceae bacterium]
MEFRNIAIIAHVDHGKTTLVDAMLRQSGTFRANQQVVERVMDSNDLEKERGITILAKCTSVQWEKIRINIVDTPGHADFGGEVERILSMVDGVVVLVDAAEGPMPQTKFVTSKALSLGLRPIVVINKVDRGDARPHQVYDEIFDLFVTLDANDNQLDFPTLFAVGRDGWADDSLNGSRKDLSALFELIINYVPEPKHDLMAPFSMLATTLEADPYLGRVLTGRIHSGTVKLNQIVISLSSHNIQIEQFRISKILAYRGIERTSLNIAEAGDIVAVSGMTKTTVSDTICSPEVTKALYSQSIDPPILAMTFSVNDSPLAGQDGNKVTSRAIGARLMREAESNVSIHIKETENSDFFEVAGRGELQLGILIEQMRREGFELSISRPRVLFKTDEITGKQLEPIEEVIIDVDKEYFGIVVEKMSNRKSEMIEMKPSGGGKVRIIFLAPSRGLIGYHSEFLTDTRGTGMMNRIFHSYALYKGSIEGRRNGVMISNGQGDAVPYSLWYLEDRGPLFLNAGTKVYKGMIIGEHSRGNDLEVNCLKAKQLTNIRTTSKDEAVRLTPPHRMSLEQAITYINDDELVEVTPKNVRLRKRLLDPNDRKRATRKNN